MTKRKPTPPTPAKAVREPARTNPNNGRKGQRTAVLTLPIDRVDRNLLQSQTRSWPWSRAVLLVTMRRMALADPILKSFMVLAQNGVIGSMPVHPTFSSVKNKKARKLLEMAWKRFEMAPTLDGRMTMREMQRAMVQQYLTDGRLFGVMHFSDEYPSGIAVQPITREALADTVGERDGGRNRLVRYGEVMDENTGRVIAYQFWEQSKAIFNSFGGGYTPWAQTGGRIEEIPAGRVLDMRAHDRLDEWDNSPSPLLAAVEGMTGVTDLDATTLRTMKAAACKMGFYKRGVDSPDAGEGVDKAGEGIDGLELERVGDGSPDVPEQMAYGSIDELPPGWEFQGFDPSWPNMDGVSYRLQLLRPIIASLGADYNTVCGDGVGVNYNSLRHFTLQTRDRWRSIQDEIRDSFICPLFLQWLEVAEMRGEITLSKESRMEAMRTPFAARTYPWVDPVKDMMAKEKQMQMLALSPQDLAAEQGRNFQDVIQDFAAAADALKGVDIDKVKEVLKLVGSKAGAPPPPPAPESDDMPDDEESGEEGKE